LKLLLDEMYSAAIAEGLRARGHDAVAAVERSELRNNADAELFALAQAEARAIVTENLDDFSVIANDHDRRAQPHHGVVLVNSRRYPRNHRRTIGVIVTALADLAERFPGDEPNSMRWWL
jgi:predicted nuclease of predicted toxin-antitoxin system